jgi:hypothetical protein
MLLPGGAGAESARTPGDAWPQVDTRAREPCLQGIACAAGACSAWQLPAPSAVLEHCTAPAYGPTQNLDLLDSKIAQLNTYQKTKYLLGWNEPDRADQANISPAVGAQTWHRLEAVAQKYNLQLGGPAIGSTPSWQDQWFRVSQPGAVSATWCSALLLRVWLRTGSSRGANDAAAARMPIPTCACD